jgi:flavin-dependent dehydrogenase
MNNSAHNFDVIIIGGGPAGSGAASILAREGKRVILFEKERFPRHHIGESLMPHTYWSFQRIGILDKMKEGPSVKKFSVQFTGHSGKESRPFYFFESNHHESAVTWQVTRSVFDEMLINHAAEQGATVHQETPVKRVLFEGERAIGVEVMLNGALQTFYAPVTIDATGQNAMLSNKFHWRVRDKMLNKAVLYSYYKGARREPGMDGGATLVLRACAESNGWFWYIPLENDITSVGIVADPEYLVQGRGQDLAQIFEEEVAKCVACHKRVSEGERVDKIYAITDYSYRSRHAAGDGFIIIGDAYGFLDPIYSSGVLLAFAMAELAADAIHEAFQHQDFTAARLGSFQAKLDQGIESMRKLVYAFYAEDFSFGKFLMKYPQYRNDVINLLIGDVFRENVDEMFGPMSDFAYIPPSLTAEAFPMNGHNGAAPEILAAKFDYYEALVTV